MNMKKEVKQILTSFELGRKQGLQEAASIAMNWYSTPEAIEWIRTWTNGGETAAQYIGNYGVLVPEGPNIGAGIAEAINSSYKEKSR